MTDERTEEKTFEGWRATTAGPRRCTVFTTKGFAAEATPAKLGKGEVVWIVEYSGPVRIQLKPSRTNPRRYWNGWRFCTAHFIYPTAYKAHCQWVKECRDRLKSAQRDVSHRRRVLAKAIRHREKAVAR